MECNCNECKAACSYKPGWFLPQEAEKVADYLGVELKELFKTKLGVDWYECLGEDGGNIFVLAPAITIMEPGEEYPADPKGTCVFFVDGGCLIHDVKPHECKGYYHTDLKEDIQKRHKAVAKAWIDHQDQIKELLGREPDSEDYDMFSFFDMF